nr:DUF418 domain-containing protein [uncultured Bacillus sp.]
MKSAPISSQERIATIDIIRGFALMGIFLVNMPTFHSPIFLDQYPEYSGIDNWVDILMQMFVQTKFYTIFSFLFGWGFFIFIKRAEQKGLHQYRLFSRRLITLLLLGTVHFILIWYGDILHTYALAGFLLLLFYKRKIKTLLIWAFSLLTLFYALIGSQFLIPATDYKELQEIYETENARNMEEYINTYTDGTYWEWVTYRFEMEVLPQAAQLPIIILPILAMFLLGLAAGKSGIFHPDSPYRYLIKNIWLISLTIGIPLAVMVGLLKLDILEFGVYQSNAVFLFTSLSGLPLCFFYMSSLTLLLQKKTWQKWLRPLKYLGQMALTNYMMQTLISVFLFLGLNLYNKVSLTVGTLICMAVLIMQIFLSILWLKHFSFGPLEWIWRSLTYGYLQPIKKKHKKTELSITGDFQSRK